MKPIEIEQYLGQHVILTLDDRSERRGILHQVSEATYAVVRSVSGGPTVTVAVTDSEEQLPAARIAKIRLAVFPHETVN
jgi:hypothetical protein